MSEQIPANLDNVGPGWRPLLLRLHEQLLTVSPGYSVRQVKEKYGTLRVYLHTGLVGHADSENGQWPEPHEAERHKREDEAARRLVRAAEEESRRVCEGCGAPGREREGAWIKTLCDGCRTSR